MKKSFEIRGAFYGEKTFPEIADTLEEPEAAVKSRYYRMVQRLRKEFGTDGS